MKLLKDWHDELPLCGIFVDPEGEVVLSLFRLLLIPIGAVENYQNQGTEHDNSHP